MKATASFIVGSVAFLAGCDPGQRYTVEFSAWDIGSVPAERIVVDTSQMADAGWKRESIRERESGGGIVIRDTYTVLQPVRIIVVPLEGSTQPNS